MNIEDLTIGQVREIAALAESLGCIASVPKMASPCATHPAIGRYCIIRTYSAGVHAGVVASVDGGNVSLSDASRIWSWNGAFTLSKVANVGPASGRIVKTGEVHLIGAIEIIPCTDEARKKIEASHE